PWDTVPLPPDAEAERVVQRWLAQSWPVPISGVRCDDDHLTGLPLQFDVHGCEFTELFSSGPDVAFHVQQTGRYRGGLAGMDASDAELPLHCNGILRVDGGAVTSGRVIRDRGALRVRLKAQRGGR
ncbi:MAG: hypothetical protein M3N26_05635, partial [Pseudomonadota bacterium]|nr:hypothetical protein [Pseudomonadota bacterium]